MDAKLGAKLRATELLRMSTIAERLLKLRGKSKQGEFAASLCVNPNTLRSYENGRSLPNQDFLERICVQFSVSPAWLLLGQGPMWLDECEAEQKGVQASAGGMPCPECAALKNELASEKQERRNLSDENRQLYRRCLELERQNGELRLALQAAGGESGGTDVPRYVQSAPLSSLHNDE